MKIVIIKKETGRIIGHNFKILVVDANSPDKTGDKVKELQKFFNNLELVVEPKRRGLGAAYIFGMLHAIEKLSAEAIMEFDGDFQHDPREIKNLVSKLDEGFDYIIGSRYIHGGEIPEEWSWYRKTLSKYGSFKRRRYFITVSRVQNSLAVRDDKTWRKNC